MISWMRREWIAHSHKHETYASSRSVAWALRFLPSMRLGRNTVAPRTCADEDRRDDRVELGHPRAFPIPGKSEDNMNLLSKQRIKVLAETNSWPLVRAEGYLDGEFFRRRGMAPSKYAQIGFDEYCLGFRAGYYDRKSPDSSLSGNRDSLDPPISAQGLK